MKNVKYHLAIDIGASGGRHILGAVDEGKLITKEVYRFENSAKMKGEHLCWDAEGLYQHVLAGMRACSEQDCHPISIGIDTWGVDFAFLDQNGDMVGDIVAYRDSRTDGMDAILEKNAVV